MCTRNPTEHAPVTPELPEAPAASRIRSKATVMQNYPRAWSFWQVPFLAMATVWLSALYALSRGPDMGIFPFGIGILLLAVPMCLAGICTSTLRRQRQLSAMFRRQGWLYALMSRRWLSTLAWTIWGLGMSVLLLLQLNTYKPVEWAILASAIPAFTVVFTTIRRRLLKEGMHKDVAITVALGWSRWFCPATVLVIYVVAMMWLSDLPQYDSMQAAIDEHKPATADRTGSVLVWEALHWVGYFDAVKAYALGDFLSTDGFGALLLIVLGTGALLYHVCLALSCFQIPRFGFVQAHLAPRSPGATFKVAAVSTFVAAFIFFPALLSLELFVSTSAEPRRVREMVEKIGNDLYDAGTREEINGVLSEALHQRAEAVKQLQSEIDALFKRLESDAVDEYLDWYYSLAGEWIRIFMLAGGTERLEDHLAKKVRKTFEQEKWYAGINAAFEQFLVTDKELGTTYEQKVRDILDRNRLGPQRSQHAFVDVTLTASLHDIMQLSFQQGFIDGVRRLLGAGAGGFVVGKGVAAIVAEKVTEKLLAKTAIKLAAKAPFTAVKALLSKAGASAAIGAAGGSVLPGVGTAAGALGGFLVGFGAGVAIDALLLELEEVLNRDEFKREIVTAIREAKREFEEDYLTLRDPSKEPPP